MTMALSVQSGMLLCELLRHEARVVDLSAVASAKADRELVVRLVLRSPPGEAGSLGEGGSSTCQGEAGSLRPTPMPHALPQEKPYAVPGFTPDSLPGFTPPQETVCPRIPGLCIGWGTALLRCVGHSLLVWFVWNGRKTDN